MLLASSPLYVMLNGRCDSVLGIVTSYGLGGLGIEFCWGASFSVPIQTAKRPTHPPAQRMSGLSHK